MAVAASTQRFPARNLKIYFARRELTRQIGADNYETVILSDENMIGRPFAFRTGRSIYPESRAALTAVSRILPKPPEKVHITVREYSSFLISCYAMSAVYGNGVSDFRRIRGELLSLKKRWPAVLRELRDEFPKAEITYGIYEQRPVESALSALVPNKARLMRPETTEKYANRSPTRQAVEIGLRTEIKTPEKADKIIEENADGEKFDPLSDAEKALLLELYAADLDALQKNFRKIESAI
jgi:hypothetical protein